jgi:ABC-type sulfate transport system permease component
MSVSEPSPRRLFDERLALALAAILLGISFLLLVLLRVVNR